MPIKIQSLFASSLLIILTACTTPEQERHLGLQLANQSSPADVKTYCAQPHTAPSIKCSDTVSATFDSDGKLWIAWVDSGHLYLQSLADNGRYFSEPVAVNTEPEAIAARGENRPKIKLDRHGNIYLTWTQNLEKRHTGNIRFSRSTDGGMHFSEPVTINDNLEIIGHSFDSLELGENGEIFIAWLDSRDKAHAKAENREFRGSSVYYAWSDDGGNSFRPNKSVAPHSCECCRLATAIDTDNMPVILWRQVFEGGIRDHALVKFADWNTPGNLKRASQENWQIDACPHHGPGLSITSEGTYHAVWFSGAGEKAGLYYARSDDAGLTYSAAYPLGRYGKHPTISALDQNIVLAWSEFDGTDNHIKLIRSKDGGKTWSESNTIAEAKGDADDAFLINDGKNFYLSWQAKQGYRIETIVF